MSAVALILGVAFALLGLSLLLVLARFVTGPSALDRLVALDALVAVIICGLMVHVARSGDSATVPAIVAVSLVGFLGSSTVARFVGSRRVGGREPATDDADGEGGR